MVMRLVLLQSLHSMFEIGPVKGDDIPRHSNGDDTVGNALQWGRKQRESVGPVSDHFRLRRHHLSASGYRALLQERFEIWNEITKEQVVA